MKKGDIVIITDGSYTRSVVNGKLVEESLNYGDRQGKKYAVVETGCVFPAYGMQADGSYLPASFNDTVIQQCESGKVVFIEERFLQLVKPKHEIMIDMNRDPYNLFGQIVKISDELYKKIKHESQTE